MIDNTNKTNTQMNLSPMVDAALSRAFIAYVLPLDLAATMNKKIRRFDSLEWIDDVRWMPPQNFHIPLRFLGDCSAQTLTAIGNDLADRLQDFPSFICMSGGLEFLPAGNNPRMMALKIHSGHRMDDLHRLCEEVAQSQGCRADLRPFHPHVTLARTQKQIVPTVVPFRSSIVPVFDRLPGYRMQVNEVSVMLSERHGDETRYRVLRTIPLLS